MEEREQQGFQDQLARINTRRRVAWWVFFGIFPLLLALNAITGSQEPLVYAIIIWLVLYSLCGALVTFSRCPRCHKFIHVGLKPQLGNILGRRCFHCQLSLFSF